MSGAIRKESGKGGSTGYSAGIERQSQREPIWATSQTSSVLLERKLWTKADQSPFTPFLFLPQEKFLWNAKRSTANQAENPSHCPTKNVRYCRGWCSLSLLFFFFFCCSFIISFLRDSFPAPGFPIWIPSSSVPSIRGSLRGGCSERYHLLSQRHNSVTGQSSRWDTTIWWLLRGDCRDAG